MPRIVPMLMLSRTQDTIARRALWYEFCAAGSARAAPLTDERRNHVAKYVVALFCPLLLRTFFASPSFRIRGISLG
jgi:hypothetical protein